MPRAPAQGAKARASMGFFEWAVPSPNRSPTDCGPVFSAPRRVGVHFFKRNFCFFESVYYFVREASQGKVSTCDKL